MPLDHSFLVSLQTADPEGWAEQLHAALAKEPHELTGCLLFREGRPLAVTHGRLADLDACAASPGALLGRAVWLGADVLLPFHTQVTADPPVKIEANDIFYAQRLRDLAFLLGGLEVQDHLLIGSTPDPVWLRERLSPPAPLDEIEHWTRRKAPPRKPNLRHPVTGELDFPGGPRRKWVQRALETGFTLEDLSVPGARDLDAPDGVPLGAGLFRTVAYDLSIPDLPAPGLQSLSTADGFEVTPTIENLARAVRTVKVESEPLVGVILVEDTDQITAPRAGLLGRESYVKAQPGHLFSTALRDGASRALTFSVLPENCQPFTRERRALMRRLAYVGLLLGVLVEDHIVVPRLGTGWTSLRATPEWRKPRLPPLNEPPWPPFLRSRQTSRIVQHPQDGRRWDERGTMPPWVRRLIDGGWDLDELRVYR